MSDLQTEDELHPMVDTVKREWFSIWQARHHGAQEGFPFTRRLLATFGRWRTPERGSSKELVHNKFRLALRRIAPIFAALLPERVGD